MRRSNRNGFFSTGALLAGGIALTLLFALHRASWESALRVHDSLERTQLHLLSDSGRQLTLNKSLTNPLFAQGPTWSLVVTGGPEGALLAKVRGLRYAR